MSTSNALSIRSESGITPFEQFLVALYARRTPQVATSMAGSAVWSDLPLADIVADGLWPVLLRAAEKIGDSMNTEAETLEIADRVNRLLNAGLILAYPTMTEAASAFWMTVIIPSLRDARSTIGTPPSPAASVWQKPAAQFFARALKAAGECREEIRKYLDPWLEHFDGQREIPLCSSDEVVNFLNLANFLSLASKERSYRSLHRAEAQATSLQEIALNGLRSRVEQARLLAQKLRLLQRLPTALERIHTDARGNDQTIEMTWIGTQILLAAIEAPTDREVLTVPEWRKGKARLRKCRVEDAAQLFVRRMDVRARRVTGEDRARLIDMARHRISELNSISDVPNQETLNHAFLVFSADDQVKLDRLSAYYMLSGGVEKDSGAKSKAFHRAALAAIDWASLTWEEIQDILVAGDVDGRIVVNGIVKLAPKLRQRAALFYLESEDIEPHPTVVAELYRKKLLPDDADFFRRFWELLPPEALEAGLLQELAAVTSSNSEQIIRMALRLPVDRAKRFFGDRAHRESIARLLSELFLSADSDLRHSLRELMGMEVWRKFILAEEVSARSEVYLRGEVMDFPGRTLPTWEARADTDMDELFLRPLFDLCDDLAIKEAKLRTFLRKNSEEKVAKWHFEGQKDAKKRVTTYLANRAKYYGAKKTRR